MRISFEKRQPPRVERLESLLAQDIGNGALLKDAFKGLWGIPVQVSLDRDNDLIIFDHAVRQTGRSRDDDAFAQFVRLGSEGATPDDVLRFAKKFGPLRWHLHRESLLTLDREERSEPFWSQEVVPLVLHPEDDDATVNEFDQQKVSKEVLREYLRDGFVTEEFLREHEQGLREQGVNIDELKEIVVEPEHPRPKPWIAEPISVWLTLARKVRILVEVTYKLRMGQEISDEEWEEIDNLARHHHFEKYLELRQRDPKRWIENLDGERRLAEYRRYVETHPFWPNPKFNDWMRLFEGLIGVVGDPFPLPLTYVLVDGRLVFHVVGSLELFIQLSLMAAVGDEGAGVAVCANPNCRTRYFQATRRTQGRLSWCPDCGKAEAVRAGSKRYYQLHREEILRKARKVTKKVARKRGSVK